MADMFNVVGVDSSIGCRRELSSIFLVRPNPDSHCFKPCEKPADEAALVKIYRHGGGIPFAKTAIPQTLLALSVPTPSLVWPALHDLYPHLWWKPGGEGASSPSKGSPLDLNRTVQVRYEALLTRSRWFRASPLATREFVV